MIRPIFAAIAIALLVSGCGADGAPEPQRGVGVSGEARIGVKGSL